LRLLRLFTADLFCSRFSFAAKTSMPRATPPPSECAQCGADIPARAKACPGCGADERTGWREQDIYDGLDLPESDTDESPPPRGRRPGQLAWYWVVTMVALLLLLVVSALGLR